MQRVQEIALITQVLTLGSQRAFGQLVQAHQEVVRRFLMRLTGGDSMRADDLAQETFIRAWQHLDSFRRLSGFQTWLMSIAYRVFLDDERKQMPMTAEPVETEPLPTDESSNELLRYDLDRALATLSVIERTCVVLQCVEGQSIKEIARITDLPENTVKSHLLRGKRNLTAFLRKNGY